MSMNMIVPIQKSIMFFMMMLPALLALVRPVSSIAKPHCMKNTSAAPIMNQIPPPLPNISDSNAFVSISYILPKKIYRSRCSLYCPLDKYFRRPSGRGSQTRPRSPTPMPLTLSG